MSINRVELIGYIGLLLVQLNVVPAIYQAIQDGSSAPLASIVMMVVGLACYLYNSLATGNILYTVGNSLGLVCNVILLGAVILK